MENQKPTSTNTHSQPGKAQHRQTDMASPHVRSGRVESSMGVRIRRIRRNHALKEKIAQLQLKIMPFIPLPDGPPHPDFPKTLMDFWLLTEPQLDDLAHYYHQSTPGPWTHYYPECMNWDKDFLAKPKTPQFPSDVPRCEFRPVNNDSNSTKSIGQPWFNELIDTLGKPQNTVKCYVHMSDCERIGIKRRKFGKFIGFRGTETPDEEITGRMQVEMELAIARSRQELLEAEEVMLGRKKVG